MTTTMKNDGAVSEATSANEQGKLIGAMSDAQAVIEFNLDGTVITANQNFCNALGYSLDEIKGQHHRMFVDSQYANSAEYQQFWAKLNRGEAERGEFLRRAKDGSEVWINATYFPITDENGRPYKVTKFAVDITKQRQLAQEAGRNSSALDSVATNVLICDADFKVVYANQKSLSTLGTIETLIQAKFGMRADQVLGGSIDRFHVNPDHQRQLLQTLRGRTHTAEFALGDEIIDLSASGLFDTSGNFTGAIVNWEIVTQQRNEARVAKRSADALEAVATNVMICDTDFNIIYCNKKALTTVGQIEPVLIEKFGVRADQVAGGSIDRFHVNPAHQRQLLQTLKGRNHAAEFKLGDETIALSASGLWDAEGEFAGAVVNWELVTEQKRMEQEVADRAKAEAAAAEELREKVDTLLHVVEDAAKGDLTATHDVDGEDPVGQLGSGLRTMISDLRGIIVQIKEGAEQFSTSAGTISNASSSLSEASQTNAATVEEMTASVDQLTESIRMIAQNASDANSIADDTSRRATAGGEAVDRSITAMKEINRSSEQISEIIQVISEIASQTNLLALNAAIEAARAGEHGLGFAVVADEVRKLAERSSEAAKQITGLIRESTQRVVEGTKLSEDTGQALKQIIDGVQSTAESISQIASATDEQSATAEEVGRAIQNVAKLTENNSGNATDMAASAEELSAQAIAMKELVRRFKI